MNYLQVIADLEEKAEKDSLKDRSKTFAVILYPDEDEKHSKFLNYVLHQPRFMVAYIRHDPDDEEKKAHIHCMVCLKNQMKLSAFIKFFDCWIKYAVLVHDRDSYLCYMLHDTPHSLEAGKKSYALSDLQGDERVWRNLRQNRNFVQFREILQHYTPGDTLLVLIDNLYNDCSADDFNRLFDFIQSNSFFMISLLNQEINILRRKEIEK